MKGSKKKKKEPKKKEQKEEGFKGRKTKTTYTITKAGEKAFKEHINAMEEIIKNFN